MRSSQILSEVYRVGFPFRYCRRLFEARHPTSRREFRGLCLIFAVAEDEIGEQWLWGEFWRTPTSLSRGAGQTRERERWVADAHVVGVSSVLQLPHGRRIVPLPSASTSLIISWSSASVGFWPVKKRSRLFQKLHNPNDITIDFSQIKCQKVWLRGSGKLLKVHSVDFDV